MGKEYTPENITHLAPDDIFVFGSNLEGMHMDQNTFYVTRIGCGIAGFTDEEIAPLFDEAYNLYNVRLPKSFADIIERNRITVYRQ